MFPCSLSQVVSGSMILGATNPCDVRRPMLKIDPKSPLVPFEIIIFVNYFVVIINLFNNKQTNKHLPYYWACRKHFFAHCLEFGVKKVSCKAPHYGTILYDQG